LSIYEQLETSVAEAETKFEGYAGECESFAREILVEIRTQLGWPEPRDRRPPRGSFDSEGRFRFGFAIRLGPIGFAYEWRLFREAGAWFVTVDDQRYAVVRSDKATLGPLVQLIEADLRKGIAEVFHENRWA